MTKLNHQQPNNKTIITGELQIPTSYGHISAKTWGQNEPNRLKILAVHGYMDNAGTFDRLFPLLPLEKVYIVILDLPGHGQSSWLPKGVPYTDTTWVMEIKRALNYLGWTLNVTLIAHSMGACACLELAALYPELIGSLVMLDTIKYHLSEPEHCALEFATTIEAYNQYLKISAFNPSILVELDRATRVIIDTHTNAKLNQTGASCLLPRAVKYQQQGSKTGVIFQRDSRLAVMVKRKFTKQQLMHLLCGINCRLLIIRARQTHHTLRSHYDQEFLHFYSEHCSEFRYIEVDGDHYVHLTNPNILSKHVIDFIQPELDRL